MEAAGPDQGDRGLIGDLLCAVRAHLGMDVAFVSEFTGGQRVFRFVDSDTAAEVDIVAGDGDPLEETYCQRIVDGALPGLIPDTAANPITRDLAVTEAREIGSYLGVPITFPDGRVYGTLCCLRRAPADLGVSELGTLAIVADVVAAHLQRIEDHLGEVLADRTLIEDVLEHRRFHPVFQPIVDLMTGAVLGVEALTRFTAEPARPPDEWFAMAAAVDLGIELEQAAMEAALAFIDDLPAAAYLSINLSVAALNASLPLLRDLDGRRIVVELTEHDEVADYDALLAIIADLRARGVRFAIDDAGAGYSSLRHVLHVAPDIIKLDISITRGVDEDVARQTLTGAFVELAARLGATVVAEGIETEAELRTLAGLGVACGQGYHLERPGLPPIPEALSLGALATALAPAAAPDAVHFAFVHAPMPIAVTTPDGRFVDVNDAFCQLLGRPAAALRGQSWQEISSAGDVEAAMAAYGRALAGQTDDVRLETTVCDGDGTEVPVSLQARVLRDPQGRPLWFITEVIPEGSPFSSSPSPVSAPPP